MPSLDEILNQSRPQTVFVPPTIQPGTTVIPKKLLIVLSFWDGDHETMVSLCKLIADLESTRNTEADILLYRRNDAQPMERDIETLLLSKFAKVHTLKCRRMNAKGYPYGSNEMFYDLIETLRGEIWQKAYYAFLNMEADCCPLAPDWITRLAKEYRTLAADGATFAIGHIYQYTHVPDHLNGAAIYSIDIFARAGGMEIVGGPGGIAYDFFHAKRILPIAKDTPLMAMDFNRKTITAPDLLSLQKQGQSPVYLHGVKDLSAQSIIRSQFIDKTGGADLSSRTITTYFDPIPGTNIAEEQACLEIFKDAWKTAGWNVVVNSRYDAQKNPLYGEFQAQVRSLPPTSAVRILRWLAFGYTGGGVHADYDVLPRHGFSPDKMIRNPGLTVMGVGDIIVQADRESITRFLKEPNTSVQTLEIVKDVGSDGWAGSHCVHFSESACRAYSQGTPKSRVMLHFFRARQ